MNKELDVGDGAPEFCLMDESKEEVCLKDYEGNWLVLYFYPKDNTPGCTLEAQNFSENLDEFKDVGANVVGISKDSPESHVKFKDKKDLKIKLLSDPEHEVLEKYGVWKPKNLFGKEILGTVRSTFLINPEGEIAYIWDNVKVSGHVLEVKQKLKELRG